MLQNPPPLPPASRSLTGAMLPHQCRAARPGTDKHREGITDRTGAGERSTSSTTTLVADEAMRPIKKSQPQLIGRNAPSRVECPRPATILPISLNPPNGVDPV